VSRKTRALVREIYNQATAVARDSDIRVNIARGCLQGCVLSPLLFCLVLAIILKDVTFDPIKVDQLCIDYLAYADDIALTANTAAAASKASQAISDASRDKADMFINIEKTESTKIKQKAVPPQTTTEEVDGLGLEAVCEYCHKSFFTDAGLRLHKRQHCQQARVLTWERTFDIGQLADVRGGPHKRWYLVEWEGANDYGKVVQGVRPGDKWAATWEPAAHLQYNIDNNGELFIDRFWRAHPAAKGRVRSHNNWVPGEHRCKDCNFLAVSEHGLKTHKGRARRTGKCKIASAFISYQTDRVVRRAKHKRIAAEEEAPVYIDGKPLNNRLSFNYLGCSQEQDATTTQAIRVRLAQGRARFNQMYPIWVDTGLTTASKLAMFKTSVCMIARHGSESWDLTARHIKMIRGWTTSCLVTISGGEYRTEGNAHTSSFDFVADIRLKRLLYLGQILRLPQDRRLRQSVEALHAGGVLPAGSILMDAPPATTFQELTARAVDVPGWMQMCAATYPTLRKPRGGTNASGSAPAAPSAALNPDATVYSPNHPNHHDGGLDVQAPGGGGGDGGGAADPTKHKETHGRWCHFVPGLGWKQYRI
jgi:hypothetical protein